jgi:transcriptional regulator with XRE-family HTH domain
MEEDIHARFRELVREFGDGKNTILAKKIGTSEANVRGYIRNITPRQDVLEKVVNNLGVDAEWLITGRGSMHKVMHIDDATAVPEKAEDTKNHEAPSNEYLIEMIKKQAEEIGRFKERFEFVTRKDKSK